MEFPRQEMLEWITISYSIKWSIDYKNLNQYAVHLKQNSVNHYTSIFKNDLKKKKKKKILFL